MAPKTIKKLISDTLENLGEHDFNKFRSQLLDRREEPRILRSKVEAKGYLVIKDVLVSTYCEPGALQVTLQVLREIDCNDDAVRLESDALANGHISKPGSSDTARPSAGASGVNTRAGGVCTAEHFVDKHRLQLTQRVSNIAPMLDELLQKKVIQQESYDKITALPTHQEKMRALYCGALLAAPACKDIFYEILQEKEPYLVDDLKGME